MSTEKADDRRSSANDCSTPCFTPGPWKVVRPGHGHATKYRCVQIGSDEAYTTLEMLPGDAKAIALLPDLIEALRTLHDFAEASQHYRRADESRAAFDNAMRLLKRVGA